MSKKVVTFVRTGAALTLPLFALAAAASHRPHHGFVAPEAPAIEAPADASATLAQAAAQQVTHAGFDWKTRLLYLLAGILLGVLAGAFMSDRFRRFRRLLGMAIIALALVGVIFIHDYLAFGVGFTVAAVTVFRLLRDTFTSGFDAIFGNAHAATRADITAAGQMLAFDPATGTASGKPGIPLGSLVE
jgi:hypothetical protein